MLQSSAPPPQHLQAQPDPVRADDGPLAQGREFLWSDADFTRIKALIYKKAGISLHDGKHAMVYSRVSRRLRDTGHSSFKTYLDWLEQHDGAEWQEFINALTTNLTAFFREQHHFEVLHELLAAKRSQQLAHLVLGRVHRRRALLHRHDGDRSPGPQRQLSTSSTATSTPRCWPPRRAASTRPTASRA